MCVGGEQNSFDVLICPVLYRSIECLRRQPFAVKKSCHHPCSDSNHTSALIQVLTAMVRALSSSCPDSNGQSSALVVALCHQVLRTMGNHDPQMYSSYNEFSEQRARGKDYPTSALLSQFVAQSLSAQDSTCRLPLNAEHKQRSMTSAPAVHPLELRAMRYSYRQSSHSHSAQNALSRLHRDHGHRFVVWILCHCYSSK